MSELNRAEIILVVKALRHYRRGMTQATADGLAEDLGEPQDAGDVSARIDELCDRIDREGSSQERLGTKAMFSRVPEQLVYCFCPGYGPEAGPQDIRLVFEGHAGFVPTLLGAPNLADAEALCALLNGSLGLDEERRQRMVARSLNLRPAPFGRAVH